MRSTRLAPPAITLFAIAFPLLGLVLTAAAAQQPTFRTEANYVRVDVYPTMDGVPVADLRRGDFELLEDGVVQSIDAFEHVIVRGVGPDQRGREPSTVAESRAMVENPRARVFVLFLDAYHVRVEGSANVRAPLTRALDRLVGPDDLFAVMTPEMSAADVAFARKTTTVAGILDRYWTWGERFQLVQLDAEDNRYHQCYPGRNPGPGCQDDTGLAEAMVDRRRERRTIDALRDLVRSLRYVREERKAILVFSEGWRLFRPDAALARIVDCRTPGRPTVGIDPGGRLTAKPGGAGAQSDELSLCDRERIRLARLDNEAEFREMLEEANRSNAAMYPVDPRGLAAFDEPISVPNARGGASRAGAPPSVDSPRLTARLDALRTMAAATDGLAVVGRNDLDRGIKRIVDDLSSYYLLGYYSSGKFDGRFHSIQVRVKRPGVQIRARGGYRAATAAEANASSKGANGVSNGVETAEARALEVALSMLNGYRRELPLRLQAALASTGGRTSAITIVGEVGSGEEWRGGADADVMLVAPNGDTVATGRAAIMAGARGFRATLVPSQPLPAGEYTARVRVQGRAASATPANDLLRLTLGSASSATGAIFIRRSANREAPTADLRFRRTEQVRVEVPAAADETATARLVDRTGKPIRVPISTATRDDPGGVRWHTAQFALAPLAAGDYVIDVSTWASGGGADGKALTRQLLAFRVVQ
jgi:VWFA-related protein